MPFYKVSSDLDMYYQIDNFTDPWTRPDTVVMLHGLAESSASWYGWVPHLARHYQVLRLDMRGFGQSTPMPADFPWSMDIVVDDILKLVDSLGVDRFHLVGAKIGGSVARYLAARFPARVRTLTVAGTPPPFRDTVAARAIAWSDMIRKSGVEGWAWETMGNRLGDDFPADGAKWWSELMGRTAASTLYGSLHPIPSTDLRPELPKITAPTLVLITRGSTVLGGVEETKAWQETIPNSKLVVLDGNSYHVAASHPDDCALETRSFIRSNG